MPPWRSPQESHHYQHRLFGSILKEYELCMSRATPQFVSQRKIVDTYLVLP